MHISLVILELLFNDEQKYFAIWSIATISNIMTARILERYNLRESDVWHHPPPLIGGAASTRSSAIFAARRFFCHKFTSSAARERSEREQERAVEGYNMFDEADAIFTLGLGVQQTKVKQAANIAPSCRGPCANNGMVAACGVARAHTELYQRGREQSAPACTQA